MNESDYPLLNSIDSELVGLRKTATNAAEVLDQHRDASAKARVAFRADPSKANLRVMWRAGMKADGAYHELLKAEDVVESVLALRQLVTLTICDRQKDNDSE